MHRLVERARTLVGEAGLEDRIRIVEGVMQNMPFPDGSFDLVWCRDVIEIVEAPDAGVAEMARERRKRLPPGQAGDRRQGRDRHGVA